MRFWVFECTMRIQALLLFLSVSSCFLFTVAEAAVINECGREDSNCGDGSCLPRASLCNGVPDCPRGEDERYCSTSWMSTTSEYCNPGEFRCLDGTCIASSWVCDGYRDCREGEDEFHCDYSTTEDPYPRTTKGPDPECLQPFDIIGGKCIMIEPMVEATWYETRYFCQKLGGDLVVLDSLDSYVEILGFLHRLGLTSRDYWVGATDEGHEGDWYWVNYVKVMNGTPLWAIYHYSSDTYYQEPRTDSSSSQNCGYLDKKRFYYMDDEDCTKPKGAICEIRNFQDASVLADEENKRAMLQFLDFIQKTRDTNKSTGNDQDSGHFDVNKSVEKEEKPNSPSVVHTETKKSQDAKRNDSSDEESAVEYQDPVKEKYRYNIIENKRDNKTQHIKNIETVIKTLKARVFQSHFENMNVLRP